MHPIAQIRQNLRIIRERYGVARIGIFGSVARNAEQPASSGAAAMNPSSSLLGTIQIE